MRNITIFIVVIMTGSALLRIVVLVLMRSTRPVYDQPDVLVQVYLNALEQNDRQQLETLLSLSIIFSMSWNRPYKRMEVCH